MSFDDLLTDRARLEHAATVTHSASGDEVPLWALEQDRVPVLVRPARAPADVRLGVTETVTHIIYCRPIRALLNEPAGNWRMLVDGIEYVLVDPSDAASRGHHLEIRARRLSP